MVEMAVPLREIAKLVNGELLGDDALVVRGLSPLSDAGPSDLSFLDNVKYISQFHETQAGAVLVGSAIDPQGKTVVKVASPYAAFAQVLQTFAPPTPSPFEGISEQAFVSPEATLAENVSVGPGAFIGPGTSIGRDSQIWPGVSIGPGCTLGAACRIFANVSIYHHCRLGDRVIIHSGSVVGADGFGFAPIGEQYRKIPQIGNVVIEDDVEIGANTTIDRAALGTTRIGRGTKIDNLVMVAHNCQIGENCILVAQVGVSGSTELGEHVVLAGQVGVCGHVQIGDAARIGAQSGVTKDLPGGQEFLGAPAMPVKDFKRLQAHIQRLPVVREKLKELESRLSKLEKTAD